MRRAVLLWLATVVAVSVSWGIIVLLLGLPLLVSLFGGVILGAAANLLAIGRILDAMSMRAGCW